MTKFEHIERKLSLRTRKKINERNKTIRVVVINEMLPSESNEREKTLKAVLLVFFPNLKRIFAWSTGPLEKSFLTKPMALR